MKKKSWKNVKERMNITIQWFFMIVFLLSVLICIIYCLKIRFGGGHISNVGNKVYDIAFYTAIFTGIVGFNDFSKSARLAAIFVCGLLGIIDLLLRL